MTLRFTQAQHTPVYSKSSADQVGKVVRYVVDTDARRIAAVHVAGRRRKALLADWANVVGFGPDAVVIDDSRHLHPPRSEFEELVAKGRLDLRGRRVLTDAGFDLGPLVDVEFDEATGTIERLETARSRVRGAGLLSIGPYAVIVSQAAVGVAEDVDAPRAP
jgi:uncharacterized protein YrrD